MKTLLTLLIGILIFTSCTSKKEITTVVEEKPVTEKYKFENVSPSDSLFASIRKGACFGQCPVYTLNIYNSGTVILVGKNFIEKIGTYKNKLNYEEMLAFVALAKEIEYLALDDSYDNKNVTDLPETSTSIVINKTRKKVYNRFGAPKELRSFENLFDEILKTEGWKKIEDNRKGKF